jgi:hypothetical protein
MLAVPVRGGRRAFTKDVVSLSVEREIGSLGGGAMYSIENHVGRLIEIRIWSPVSVGEAGRWGREHESVVGSMTGSYACFVDVVDATVFPQDVVDALLESMKHEPRLLRTATLLSPSPTLGLQIQRMLREANHPERRAFRDPRDLEAWLGSVLTQPERARLRELLDRRSDVFGSGPGSTRAPLSTRGPASTRAPASTRTPTSMRWPTSGRPQGNEPAE